ncbi:response regulator [Geomonas sp. RF6]|uniref:response regulator n=1 Tax=Geomonas sp. RF6 TaxID=2897342 RepID=UPI001E3E985F|nr:response regulator [Geomonas sp. RF6]UFS71390.1 response regulator [Geomonas sp. RF6]
MSGSRGAVLIVGSNRRNQDILFNFITSLGYAVSRADSLEDLDAALTTGCQSGFALVDITGFDRAIWERCTRLNADDIPLLVISPRQSSEVTKLGIAHGAQSVLAKPLVMRELADTIRGFMKESE